MDTSFFVVLVLVIFMIYIKKKCNFAKLFSLYLKKIIL